MLPDNWQELDDNSLLLPNEVASIFRVDVKTVSRWAKDGQIQTVRTGGKHRRYRKGEVMRLMQEGFETRQ